MTNGEMHTKKATFTFAQVTQFFGKTLIFVVVATAAYVAGVCVSSLIK